MRYFAEDDLLALGVPEPTVHRLMRDTHLSGHDGRPVVDEVTLRDLIAGHCAGEDE